jgi:hypothetical protein
LRGGRTGDEDGGVVDCYEDGLFIGREGRKEGGKEGGKEGEDTRGRKQRRGPERCWGRGMAQKSRILYKKQVSFPGSI